MQVRNWNITLGVVSAILIPVSGAWAAGGWNGGQDIYHVPLSWCIVQGSPAQASPNVAGDTFTDDLIWRRHERPTDNIYINQTGITFRSAINDIWGQLNFPIIPDPDTTLATPGDMRGEDVNNFGSEFNAMLSSCETAWDNLGRSGIGITAVNAGAFHDGTGAYVGTIGWGGCVESVLTGVCTAPYEGVITVVDNHYLHPSVPNRTLPGTNQQFALTDPADQLVGHELGHALSLDHRTNNTALMNPGPVDNNSNGQSDNYTLNATEVNAVRTSAQIVPGLEIDPPRLILPGKVRAHRRPDKVREHTGRPAHLDLASVKVTGDVEQREIAFTQQLFGKLPATAKQQHWFLIDTDDAVTGAAPAAIGAVGGPATLFTGAEVVLRADVAGQTVTGGQAWRFQAGNLVPLVGVNFGLRVLVMHPLRTTIVERGRPVWTPPSEGHTDFPVHHIVAATLPAEGFESLLEGKPFRVQALIVTEETGQEPVDEIDVQDPKRGVAFDLQLPSFPHCFAQGEGVPGGKVVFDTERLRPKMGVHGLIGPRLVFRGTTDEDGAGMFEFDIPEDIEPGFHLVTIGNDGTALTADCVVNILAKGEQPPAEK